MKRRALLRAATGGGAVLVAGCLEDDGDPDRSGVADDRSPTPTGGPTPTETDGGPAGDEATETEAESTADPTEEPTDTDSAETEAESTAETTETTETTETEPSSDGEEASPTETAEETPTEDGEAGSNAMVDRSFEVVGTECGQGANSADVSRGDDSVDVDGTIRGRNGCYTAELERAAYDDAADELTVEVRAYDDSGEDEACQECIVDVDYRGTFEFEDGTPSEVSIFHDGEHVTTE